MSAFAISHRGELQRCKNTPDSVGGRQLWLGAGEGIVLGDFAPFSPSEESAVLCWGVMSHPIPPPRTSSPSSSVSQPQAAASPVGAVGWQRSHLGVQNGTSATQSGIPPPWDRASP